MLTFPVNILVIGLALLASWGLMAVLNHFWPVAKRYTTTDQIGWQLNVLGTTYAVILGFMLFTEWTAFTEATANSDLEASSLRNVYRLAEGLPSDQRVALQRLARDYADTVVDKDWPTMIRGEVPEQSSHINEQMWKTLMSIKTSSISEGTAENRALAELATMSQHRAMRLVQSEERLPTIFWCLLLVGGVLTIISVVTFGSVNLRLHAIQVTSLTLLITLAMLSIADVNRPFRGWIHVSNYAFKRAQQTMREAP